MGVDGPLGTHGKFGEGVRSAEVPAPLRAAVGTRQRERRISTAQQGSRTPPSSPGLLIKYAVILKQNYFKK